MCICVNSWQFLLRALRVIGVHILLLPGGRVWKEKFFLCGSELNISNTHHIVNNWTRPFSDFMHNLVSISTFPTVQDQFTVVQSDPSLGVSQLRTKENFVWWYFWSLHEVLKTSRLEKQTFWFQLQGIENHPQGFRVNSESVQSQFRVK